MGNCAISVKGQMISEDLKHSWYFRIWALLWLLCALLAFSALIILGGRSAEMAKEPGWRSWMQKETEINFPLFQIKTLSNETFDFIQTFRCKHVSSGIELLIPTSACDGKSEAQCILFDTAGVNATPDNNEILCEFNITSPVGEDRTIEFLAMQTADERPPPSLFIQPTANAQIVVQPTIMQAKGEKQETHWDARLNYKSSVQENTFFMIQIIMGSFTVMHFEEDAWYDGWMSLGEVGGFAFFLYILHTIAMTLVGFFLENNSTFLAGNSERTKYSNIPGERL